jgi:NADPH-dependent curcumin reductase
MDAVNRQFQLAARPVGLPKPEDWSYTEAPIPEPGDGEVLVKVQYLSLDPAMRGWMNDTRSYIAPVGIGEVMRALGGGEVIASRNPDVSVGEHVTGLLGVQEYALAHGNAVLKVDTALAPLPVYLGTLGMPGMTAYFGLLDIGMPKEGETVVVSGAAGAVGGVVGQIAKLKGCRVVGIAGGADKCRYVKEELGFDECIDYRAPDFEQQLAAATPKYVNVLFENVGGPVFDAVLQRVADHARIALCGNISQYNAKEPYGIKGLRQLLMHRVTVYAFVIADHRDYWPAALADLSQWVKEGKIRFKEDVSEGLLSAPDAFVRMLTGGNFGKQLVKVG